MDFHRRSLKRRRLSQPTPQTAAAQETVITCYWCLEDRPISKCCEKHQACYECIIERFNLAAQSEEHYPLKWPGIELKVDDYTRILSRELVRRFKEKEKEYRTPVDERIYCRKKATRPSTFAQAFHRPVRGLARTEPPTKDSSSEECGGFVGRVKTLPDNGNNMDVSEKDVQARCKSCRTSHCLVCGQAYVNGGHRCYGMPSTREVDNTSIGVPGKDFQYCPSTFCRRKIQLMDGCNHMHCKCGQSFCYICGEPVDVRQTKHWGKGGCPRYNHPDASNANWDNDEALGRLDGDDEIVRQELERARRDLEQRRRNTNEMFRQMGRLGQNPAEINDFRPPALADLRRHPAWLPLDGRGRRNAIAPVPRRTGRADAAILAQQAHPDQPLLTHPSAPNWFAPMRNSGDDGSTGVGHNHRRPANTFYSRIGLNPPQSPVEPNFPSLRAHQEASSARGDHGRSLDEVELQFHDSFTSWRSETQQLD